MREVPTDLNGYVKGLMHYDKKESEGGQVYIQLKCRQQVMEQEERNLIYPLRMPTENSFVYTSAPTILFPTGLNPEDNQECKITKINIKVAMISQKPANAR